MEYIETPWFNDVPYSFSDIIKKNSLMHKYKEYVLLLCMEVFFIIRRTPKVGGGEVAEKTSHSIIWPASTLVAVINHCMVKLT